MTTDAASGETRVWLARRGQALIGNQRALDIVRGESFPGIVFADAKGAEAGGKFRVVEPRQIFPRGQLQFLLSIIPHDASRVTMSVVVDAESQRVAATFPATPQGDEELISYLRTGRLSDKAEDEAGVPDEPGTAEGTDPRSTLRRLLRENRAEQRRAAGRISQLKAQERDLLRLLEAGVKEP